MVRVAGVEPALLSELDFESSASTNSTTPACAFRETGNATRGTVALVAKLRGGLAVRGIGDA
jgi:hypothetical protein